jgi:glucan 1,3-beta-glucosidase
MQLGKLTLPLLALTLRCAYAQDDPVAQVPPSESTSLYPAYTYIPSVLGEYKPHPHGSPLRHGNGSVNPQHPHEPPHGPPSGPPELPPIGPGRPSSFWYEQIKHDGISPFIENGTQWKVYRNVKEYGAKGDGRTDDTEAIIAAINDQDRGPGGNGKGTTGAPAVIYFPSGTYVISNSIPMYVDTILMGNPISRPTLLASSGFTNTTLVKGFDPAFDAPTNFYMGVKNLVFDSTHVSGETEFLLLDWGVSQATQLTNTLFRMPGGSAHTGVSTVEGGSGTFMGNLDFEGGAIGLNYNNQQYNIKDITFTGCQTGVVISHGFDQVFQGIQFKDCNIGINATAGGVGNVGSYALVDSEADSIDTLILTKSQTTSNSTTGDDSVVIDNLRVTNVNKTVVAGDRTLLTGSVPKTWVYGNAYVKGGSVGGVHNNGVTYDTSRSPSLLAGGKYFTMAPPTYQEYSVKQVVNIKDVGGYPVYGDGQTVSHIPVCLPRLTSIGRHRQYQCDP